MADRHLSSPSVRRSPSHCAQERLKQLLPPLAEPVEEGACTWMQWAFACVRSRIFQLDASCFAFVPFLDMANHALPPVAAFHRNGSAVEMLAVADALEGDEVTMCYTPLEGYANQRLMQQYGFVLEGGNAADRLPFFPESDAPDR